jgi:hypothetical protein
VDFNGTHLQGHKQTFSAKLYVAGASSFWQANRDRASSEEDSDIPRIGQVLEDKVSDIVWEAHELKSLLYLAKALGEEILRSLELLADYSVGALSVLSCEGKCLGHVQSIDLDDLRSVALVDNSYDAIQFLEHCTYLDTSSLCADLREA